MLRRRRSRHRPDLARRVPAPRRRPGAAARHRGRLGRAGAVGQPRLAGAARPSSTAAGSRSGRPRAPSVLLARMWLAEVHGVHPEYFALPAGPQRDAAGGRRRGAHRRRRAARHCTTRRGGACTCTTSAQAWRDWTGLPMVFAVWAARRDYAEPTRAWSRTSTPRSCAAATRRSPTSTRSPHRPRAGSCSTPRRWPLLPHARLLPRRAAARRAARVRPPSRGRRPVAAAAGHHHLRQRLTVQARQSVPR